MKAERNTCNSFSEFLETVRDGEYLFRGHRGTSWLLIPDIYRSFSQRETDKDFIYSYLMEQITYMKSMLETYTASKFISGIRDLSYSTKEFPFLIERFDDRHEIFTIGRHYGLHVPFLDWTTDIAVAAHFALGKSNQNDSETAIWALSITPLSKCLVKADPCQSLTRENRQSAVQIEIKGPYIDIESAMYNAGDLLNLTCFVFPISVQKDMRRYISQNGITEEWIFPDNFNESTLGTDLEKISNVVNESREKYKLSLLDKLLEKTNEYNHILDTVGRLS